MAKDRNHRIIKPSNWFANKYIRLSFSCGRSDSSLSTLNIPSSQACTPKLRNISREDELKEVFCRFDGDGDDKISALELRSYFGSIGEYLSHEEAEAMIDELDSDGDKMLNFNDFLRLMKREGDDLKEEADDLKKAFEMFELEKGSGCITPKSLQRMLHRLGDPKSLDECAAIIHIFDTDGNGVIDFHEFCQMMA